MPTRCLLVPMGPGIPKRRYDTALRLARSLQAHVDVQFISPDPAQFITTLPEVAIAAGVSRDSVAAEISQSARAIRRDLEAWCRDHDVPFAESSDRLDAVYVSWREIVGDLETEVALAGRVNDLTIIEKPDLAEPFTSRVFDAAVFSSGRPALVVPDGEQPTDLLAHVAIAWNGSLEAARTVGQSIALLHEAERVTIVEVATPRSKAAQSANLASYLRYHGIVADWRRVERKSSESVAETILEVAQRAEVSLLAMGAYTHSRLREFLLGGVTKHMIRHAQIPLLMAH